MKILCVCTGNTCRSPMLMTLLKGLLTQRGIAGIQVESVGTGAGDGEPATPHAVTTMAEVGLDLRAHRSRHVGHIDLQQVDLVLCMTSSHAAYIRSQGVPANRIEVVNAEQGGVPDPFGGPLTEYQRCAAVLDRFARTVVDRLATSASRVTDMPSSDLIDRANAAIDAIHASEPSPPTGKPSELAYAGHVEQWITRLVEQPSLALRLAARAQHLERWVIPRSSYPMDKPGYLTWRKAVHKRQGERAKEILTGVGLDTVTAERVGVLVAKAAPKGDSEAQALEDAACLTFLATELGDFASHHPDYTREKFIDIIRKTWRKMSPRGHELALTIPLPEALKELVKAAVAG